MADAIKFETYHPRLRGESGHCDLCDSHSALLRYFVQGGDGVSQTLHGYCCSVCAANLVEALAQRQIAGLKKAVNVESLAALEAYPDFA